MAALADKGTLVFRPYYPQSGRGPHLLDWAYCTDTAWDSFPSNIAATKDGVTISDTEGRDAFGINVRWNVEGFGYIFITADNAGEFYRLPASGTKTLNLAFELLASRVARNAKRLAMHRAKGWTPSREVQAYVALSEGYQEDARKAEADGERCAALSQTGLYYAMWVSEKIELEAARHAIAARGFRKGFYTGCDARGYFQMDVELFLEIFPELFNYATITYYLKAGVFEDFEPVEGQKQFALRDALFAELKKRNIVVEGRPLWWSYKTTTPDWLRGEELRSGPDLSREARQGGRGALRRRDVCVGGRERVPRLGQRVQAEARPDHRADAPGLRRRARYRAEGEAPDQQLRAVCGVRAAEEDDRAGRVLSAADAIPVREPAQGGGGRFRHHGDPDVLPVPGPGRYAHSHREVRGDRQDDPAYGGGRFLGTVRGFHQDGQAAHLVRAVRLAPAVGRENSG